jgi:uncharacterized protein
MTATERDFQVFVKPAGAICNLDCRYCYYLKKEALYPEKSPRMEGDLLESYIAQHIEASTAPTIQFSWHGGEPTILGLDYFRKVVELERKHLPPGRRIMNGIQTNGILLNEDWCRFMAASNFGVGLSIDGPADLHDHYRVNKGEQPTQAQVLRAFELLRKHRIPIDLLCVVSDCNVRHPLRVYRFFKEIGSEYVGFLPAVEPSPGTETGVTPYTVPAEAYGEFLCTIFDEWRTRDLGRIMVQIFEEASRPTRGLDHSLCIFRETCGQIPAVEHNGDFYSCDHFVTAAHKVGNIRETPLAQLLDSPQQSAFGRAKRDTLPRYCLDCEVLSMCNGGCPKDRFLQTPDGEPGLNYLCVGLKRFFGHCRPHLQKLASRFQPLQSKAQTGPLPAAKARTAPKADRNDPCPCGSGRKYKKCCL